MKVTKMNVFLSMFLGLGLLSACGSGSPTTNNTTTTTTNTAAPAASVAGMDGHIKEVEGLAAVDMPMNAGMGQKQYIKMDARGGSIWLFDYKDEGKTVYMTVKTSFVFAEIDKDLLGGAAVEKTAANDIFKCDLYSVSFSGKNLKDFFAQEKYLSKDAPKKEAMISVSGATFRDEASANSFLQELKSGVAAAQ